jgi:hypothetical protein
MGVLLCSTGTNTICVGPGLRRLNQGETRLSWDVPCMHDPSYLIWEHGLKRTTATRHYRLGPYLAT